MQITKGNTNFCYTHQIEDEHGNNLADVFKGRDGLWHAVIMVPNYHNRTNVSATAQARLLTAVKNTFDRLGLPY